MDHEGIKIPESDAIVNVHLINTAAWRTERTSKLFKPAIPGFELINLPSWSFLISHGSTHILFDLSIREDWQTGFPPVFDPLVGKTTGDPDAQFVIQVQADVRDVLEAEPSLGLNASCISAVVWSHHHFDHRGDISRFPASTQLVLGPGLRESYLPGYPTDTEGELAESDFMGRPVLELDRTHFSLNLGGFPAYDYFNDGSLYLLSSPGHTNGHLSALARVTASVQRSTFLFLAGDCSHHPGVFRPSQLVPLPRLLSLRTTRHSWKLETNQQGIEILEYDGNKILEKLHQSGLAAQPFLDVDEEPMCENHPEAVLSRNRMQLFDASDHVLVCIAHDATLLEYLPVFPEKLNDWHPRDLKKRLFWQFITDFDLAGCENESNQCIE